MADYKGVAWEIARTEARVSTALIRFADFATWIRDLAGDDEASSVAARLLRDHADAIREASLQLGEKAEAGG